VNRVHECKGWRTPEGSQMEMEAAEEDVFFVNILVTEEEVMEDLSSVLQEEEEGSLRLEQRLGSHVGGGRCVRKESMARREREEITRQLGDSPRACRRQEIMDMNVEERAMLPVDKV
jgi:hypothetical protein